MAAEADDAELPTSRMRGTEPTYAVVAGLAVAVAAVVLLVDRSGKGAPAHPGILWQVLALAAAAALVGTVRLRNRLASASLALVGGFFVGQVKSPNALAGVRTAGFLLPAAFAVLVYFRQTRADRAKRQADRAAGRAPSGGRGRTGAAGSGAAPGAGATVTARSRPTGRYTPPKDRTPPAKGRRRR
ncbi:MAG TPA: hypothetical protein VFP61_05630 [Acidimicrobiales bacterium]|nr:hypothetical protein [Acidimicrobiales bacterium]